MAKIPNNVVFYDNICVLCDVTVQFLIRQKGGDSYFFAPIGGEHFKKLARRHKEVLKMDSIFFYQNEQVFYSSSAVLRILTGLGGSWVLLKVFYAVPAFMRNSVYSLVTICRYRIFGKAKKCILPNSAQRVRFLD